MKWAKRTVKEGFYMADFEHANSLVRMAHKDFNVLTDIIATNNGLIMEVI